MNIISGNASYHVSYRDHIHVSCLNMPTQKCKQFLCTEIEKIYVKVFNRCKRLLNAAMSSNDKKMFHVDKKVYLRVEPRQDWKDEIAKSWVLRDKVANRISVCVLTNKTNMVISLLSEHSSLLNHDISVVSEGNSIHLLTLPDITISQHSL